MYELEARQEPKYVSRCCGEIRETLTDLTGNVQSGQNCFLRDPGRKAICWETHGAIYVPLHVKGDFVGYESQDSHFPERPGE